MTYQIKWEALEDKEVRKQFASSVSYKFRQLPVVFEDIEKEWLLFRSAIISSAAESCGRKWLREEGDSEKRTPWRNQEVKEAIRAKKDAFQAWLQDSSSSDLQSRHTEARKVATSAVKKIREVKERVCSLVGFQLFFSKQGILADHPPFTWQKVGCHAVFPLSRFFSVNR